MLNTVSSNQDDFIPAPKPITLYPEAHETIASYFSSDAIAVDAPPAKNDAIVAVTGYYGGRDAKFNPADHPPADFLGLSPEIEDSPNFDCGFTDKLCSGYGQGHSNNPKYSIAYRKEYVSITLSAIYAMAANPSQVIKENARWFIPSNLITRDAAAQRKHGEYYAVWVDLDNHTTLDAIKSLFLAELSGVDYLAYNSSSAKKDFQKWRVIIPLATPTTAENFTFISEIINDKFQAAGIVTDRASERVNQICYLPNRGEFYDHYIYDGLISQPLDWQRVFNSELADKRAKADAEKEQIKVQREISRIKAAERMASGVKSPVDAFNYAFTIEQLFKSYGYKRNGIKWLSPNSESGQAGAVIKGGKWVSSHGSDVSIGKNGTGDAFDLFCYYEHGNDYNRALKAAGDMFTTDSGVTITKQNQRDHMARENAVDDDFSQSVAAMVNNANKTKNEKTNQANNENEAKNEKSSFSFAQFSVTDNLDTMRTQMLNDVFVLDGIALLGQLTAIYAKPNTGKTLLTLWMLVESIKAGRIKGENVHYINADDTYKGLITKAEIAKQYGFGMIAPSFMNFKVEDFNSHLCQLIADDTARGVVIVLDTLKKFTDLMDKKKGSEFMKVARKFSTKGGTIIMLAHTNKNRTGEGKVVAGGTSDIGDDCDCAYTLDEVTGNSKTHKEVLFENFKSRGNVKRELLATYSIDEDIGGYRDLFLSVEIASSGDIEQAKKERDAKIKAAMDKDAIEAITDAINQGNHKKPEIVKYVKDFWNVSRAKAIKTLGDYTGTTLNNSSLWRVQVGDKNSQIYYLLTHESESPEFYEKLKNGV